MLNWLPTVSGNSAILYEFIQKNQVIFLRIFVFLLYTFIWNHFPFFYCCMWGSASNSQSFQSSTKRIISHSNIHIILLMKGWFGNTYKSSKFHTPLQIITIQTHTKKIFRFELCFFLKFFIFLKIDFVLFRILFVIIWYSI